MNTNILQKSVASVIGGHEYQADDKVSEEAFEVGRLLVSAGYTVRTGGYGGLMEAVSKGALQAGEPAEGVGLANWSYEKRNEHVPPDRYLEADTIFNRTEQLLRGAKLIIALPGSVGTLGELFVSWTCLLMDIMSSESRIILFGRGWSALFEVLSDHFSVTASKTARIEICESIECFSKLLCRPDNSANPQEVEKLRWDKLANSWETELAFKGSYVHSDNGYARFDSFLSQVFHRRFFLVKQIEALDLGCGTGAATQSLLSLMNDKNHFVVDGLDFSEEMLKLSKEKSVFRNLMLQNLRFFAPQKESYDFIFSRGILLSRMGKGELVQTLSRLKLALRPEGVFVFDFLNRIWDDKIAATGKLRLTCEEISEVLESAGLRITDAEGLTFRTLNIACTPRA